MEQLRNGGLVVGPARWPNGADAAVSLMVDDLTDGWIDRDGSGQPTGVNDWGAGLDRPGSSFRFLLDSLLQEFPEIRTTFFVPVDRVEDIQPARFPCRFQPIDARPEFARFLREIEADPRFECAYHGKEHGRPAASRAGYTPEFELHPNAEAARRHVESGKEIWRNVFDRDPAGGKFPAYGWGKHGEQAVDESGFAWWCRRWDRDLAGAGDPLALEPRFFGESPVVDVPSTLYGGFLTQPRFRSLQLSGIPGALRYRARLRRELADQIDELVAARGVVTVQQHITSSRPDGDSQTPNLRDDTTTVRRIFERLRNKQVWHATCGEIAAYWEARTLAIVRALSAESFSLSFADGRERGAPLSIALSCAPLPDVLWLLGDKDEHRVRVSRRFGRYTAVTSPVPLRAGTYRIARTEA